MGHAAHKFDMEALVGTILFVGVIASIAFIITGVAWNWLVTGSLGFDYLIAGENFFGFLLRSISQLFDGSPVQPHELISLGIVTLMLTPFLRVAASFVYFAVAEKNWKFSLITLIVLVVLTYSLFLR
jgi:uncharacterized membrane protein